MSASGMEANSFDYEIIVSKFELQSRYYAYFRANALA